MSGVLRNVICRSYFMLLRKKDNFSRIGQLNQLCDIKTISRHIQSSSLSFGNMDENGGNQKKLEEDSLEKMTKEELIAKITKLEIHVTQLKNIISKQDPNKTGTKKKKQKPFDFNCYNTRHVALHILYLGWDYHGFVVQEDASETIENHLFQALVTTKLIESRETSNYHRCGRTDKGVSAFKQVISIDLRSNLLEGAGIKIRENGTTHLRKGDTTTELNYVKFINRLLPPEIRVLSWSPVPDDFSARFSCKERTYKYYFPKENLNLEKMSEASTKLIGEHDFRNLCKMDIRNGVVKYFRLIKSTDLKVVDSLDNDYQMCELTIVGKAFLWHQIRCIVAILYMVGQEHEDPSIIDELLDVKKNPHKPQYEMASELPLVLFDCQYDDMEWVYEEECHMHNIKHLQRMWAQSSIKASMIKRMLESLETEQVKTETGSKVLDVKNQSKWIVNGSLTKPHNILLERQTCESLETRLGKHAKKRKIEDC